MYACLCTLGFRIFRGFLGVKGFPARQAMALYYEGKDLKGRQGNFCSIASVLSDDYKKAFNKGIKTKSEYEAVATVAQDRVEWKSVVAKVTGVFCELKDRKLQREGRLGKRKEPCKESKNRCFLVCLSKKGVIFRSACTDWRARSCIFGTLCA